MAQLVSHEIIIEGKPVTHFRSLRLDQGIFTHHHFQLVCAAEAIDDKAGAAFNRSGHLIGARIIIRLTPPVEGQRLEFAGIVTHVQTARCAGHAGDVIISGYSPTILLDNGEHCRSWDGKSLKTIVTDVLQHFPANLLNPSINPVRFHKLPYTVQYRETAWQFINRMAVDYGEWLYYNGRELIMGMPQRAPIKMVYGVHLNKFTMSMQARPVSFQALTYDYLHHKEYQVTPYLPAQDVQGWHRRVLENSRRLYNVRPKLWYNQQSIDKSRLDEAMNLRMTVQCSHMVQSSGTSDVPGIQPGKQIQVKGRNVYSNSEEYYGRHTVVSVQHVCDGQGQYSNEFTAVPAYLKVPPVQPFAIPRCETQSAVVTNNYDTKGLGRVRVRFHWMDPGEESPWLRVTIPHAGSGRGLFALPEIGEEVMVAFEGDHPSRPYVIGSLYHGGAVSQFATKNNDIKIFQSRSGNKIQLNDEAGSVFVEDKNGNSLFLNGAGAVVVKANKKLTFQCGKAAIEMEEDGTIRLNGKEVTIKGKSKVVVKGGKITLN